MATLMPQININLTGVEANEILFDPIFMDGGSMTDFKVYPNVKKGAQKIYHVTELENIVREKTGCGFDPIGNMNIYDREIRVYEAKVELEQCIDEFEDTVFQTLLKSGNLRRDIQGTEIMNILSSQVQMATAKDLKAMLWFGNKATGAGRLKVVDGLLSVHIPNLVAANLCPYKNAGSGSALNAGDARIILTDVYDNQAEALYGMDDSQKVFYVSRSVYSQLRADMEAIGATGGFTSDIESGRRIDRFRGIKIEQKVQWDSLSTANSHYVVLTNPKNIVVGTDIMGDASRFKVWYNEEQEMVRIKATFMLGVDYVHPSLFSVAY